LRVASEFVPEFCPAHPHNAIVDRQTTITHKILLFLSTSTPLPLIASVAKFINEKILVTTTVITARFAQGAENAEEFFIVFR
jgi:hypothetical protein